MRTTPAPLIAALLVAALSSGCKKGDETSPHPSATTAQAAPPPSATGHPAAAASATGGAQVPADGKYENVRVEGKLVPMLQVMEGGAVVLVDTDGAKPRTWEEQYKRKGALPAGHFDLHKTDANRNNKFDDDPVDRQGSWVIDGAGNITAK